MSCMFSWICRFVRGLGSVLGRVVVEDKKREITLDKRKENEQRHRNDKDPYNSRKNGTERVAGICREAIKQVIGKAIGSENAHVHFATDSIPCFSRTRPLNEKRTKLGKSNCIGSNSVLTTRCKQNKNKKKNG